jgi:hypothetical protein
MNAVLVKIDVAAADLGVSIRTIEKMVDGGDLTLAALVWVFDFANVPGENRRDLRFWRPELAAHAAGNPRRFGGYELAWVIKSILPERRANFHAGEFDQLFQSRHCTRRAFPDLAGRMQDRRNFYARAELVDFLTRRWLGAVFNRKPSTVLS